MADKPTEANGCGFALAWIVGVPLVVVLLVGGDGDWLVGAFTIGAVALVALVTLAEVWPSRSRRR